MGASRSVFLNLQGIPHALGEILQSNTSQVPTEAASALDFDLNYPQFPTVVQTKLRGEKPFVALGTMIEEFEELCRV